MLPRQIDLFDNVDEKVHHGSHEHAEVVNVIDDVWVLLDDVSTAPVKRRTSTGDGVGLSAPSL